MGQRCCCRNLCSTDPKVLLDDESGGSLFLFLSSAEGQQIKQYNATKIAAKALLTAWEYHNAILLTNGKPKEVVSSIQNIKVVGLGEATWRASLNYIRVDATFSRPKPRRVAGTPKRNARGSRVKFPEDSDLSSEAASYFIYRDAPPDVIHYKSPTTGFSAVKGLNVPEYGI
jgi:hypothetical protein